MEKSEVQKLMDDKTPELLALIRVDGAFLAQLVAEGVIQQYQKEDQQKEKRSEIILEILSEVRKNPRMFPKFCSALEKTQQEDALEVLTPAGAPTPGSAAKPKSPIAKVKGSPGARPRIPQDVQKPCGGASRLAATSIPSDYQPDEEMTKHLEPMLNELPDLPDDSKIVIAILDSGIWTEHPRLEGAIIDSHNCVPGAEDDLEMDQENHGTPSAGIVVEFAEKCVQIVNFKVYDRELSDTSHQQKGFEEIRNWETANGRKIDIVLTSINNSIRNSAPNDDLSDLLNSLAREKVLIASAANQGAKSNDTVCFPATERSVLAIGSRTLDGHPASYSSQGQELDFMFPGDGVVSTSRPAQPGEPDRISLWDYPQHKDGDWVTLCSGTSFAAPHCAAAVAIILALAQHDVTLGSKYKEALTRSDTMRELLKSVCKQKHEAATGYGYPHLEDLDAYTIKRFCDRQGYIK